MHLFFCFVVFVGSTVMALPKAETHDRIPSMVSDAMMPLTLFSQEDSLIATRQEQLLMDPPMLFLVSNEEAPDKEPDREDHHDNEETSNQDKHHTTNSDEEPTTHEKDSKKYRNDQDPTHMDTNFNMMMPAENTNVDKTQQNNGTLFDASKFVKLPNGNWAPSCKHVPRGVYCLKPDGEDKAIVECLGENIGYQFSCADDMRCYSAGPLDVDCIKA